MNSLNIVGILWNSWYEGLEILYIWEKTSILSEA